MKVYTIIKTVYNPAYGDVISRQCLVSYLDKEKAEDSKRRYEKKIYTQPTYFSIDETPLED